MQDAVERCGGELSVREAARMRQLAQDTADAARAVPKVPAVGAAKRVEGLPVGSTQVHRRLVAAIRWPVAWYVTRVADRIANSRLEFTGRSDRARW